jgi:hypothetical protein
LSLGWIDEFLMCIRMMIGYFLLNFFKVYTSINGEGSRIWHLDWIDTLYLFPYDRLAPHLFFCVLYELSWFRTRWNSMGD